MGEFERVICPGAKSAVRPEIVFVRCNSCSGEVEMFTDEIRTDCPHCGAVVFREKNLSCFDWCQYAEKCKKDLGLG